MSGGNGSDSAQMPGMLRKGLAEQRSFRTDKRAVKAGLRDLAARALSLDATIDDDDQAVVGEGNLASSSRSACAGSSGISASRRSGAMISVRPVAVVLGISR